MVDEFAHLRERGLTQESVYRGSLLKIRVDTVALPDGSITNREIVEHPGAVAIAPVTKDGQVVLVRQFRYPISRITLELPAGRLEWGEDAEQTCRRELAEETGLSAGKLERLGQVVVAPGYSNEQISIYLATDLQEGLAHPEKDEFIETITLPLAEAYAMIDRGEIQDSKTIIGLCWLQRRGFK